MYPEIPNILFSPYLLYLYVKEMHFLMPSSIGFLIGIEKGIGKTSGAYLTLSLHSMNRKSDYCS